MCIRDRYMGLYPSNASLLNTEQMANNKTWMPPMNLTYPKNAIENLNNSALPYNISAIPVKNYLRKEEKVLKMTSCKLYMDYRHEYFNSEKARKTYEQYRGDLEKACRLLGVECKDLKGEDPSLYCDYIVASEFDGKAQKISDEPGLARRMLEFYTQTLLEEVTFNNQIMPKIIMDSFKREIQAQFEAAKAKKGPKLVVYGTHDDLLLGYLHALNFLGDSFKVIEYASHIVFELWKVDNRYKVNVTYNGRNMAYEEESKFYERIEKKGKLDKPWDEVCNSKMILEGAPHGETSNSINWKIVLLCVLALVIMIIGLAVKMQKKKRSEAYESTLISEVTTNP
eukprot:TRINITY_DN6630_c0_g1_i7.p1 TRINITY_DN6630_c0_g1~~TRINITY_DN6630_c0_g1_i7.p1  ORF type:complete len:340 (+),score=98.69 TRINITY_DN6630_c0_g1_i7:76-1095(+)